MHFSQKLWPHGKILARQDADFFPSTIWNSIYSRPHMLSRHLQLADSGLLLRLRLRLLVRVKTAKEHGEKSLLNRLVRPH